jgi:hypothetical protein
MMHNLSIKLTLSEPLLHGLVVFVDANVVDLLAFGSYRTCIRENISIYYNCTSAQVDLDCVFIS